MKKLIIKVANRRARQGGLCLMAQRSSCMLRLMFWIAALTFTVRADISKAQDSLSPLGYVSDFARIIDADSQRKIEALCGELDSKAASEIAVVTVSSLEGVPIEEFAVKLFEQWGIGKKGKDSGLMLLVAVQERQTRIEVGYGLEPVITDGYSGDVLRSLQPYFRANQYGPGLYMAAYQLAAKIASSAGVELSMEPRTRHLGRERKLPIGGSTLVFLVLIILANLLGRGGRGRGIVASRSGRYYRRGHNYGGGFGGFGGFGGSGGGGFGGFGGFGGGRSGGGGASSGW